MAENNNKNKKRKFEDLTTIEKYKKLHSEVIAFRVLQWVSIILPFVILIIINREVYFTYANGLNVSCGLVLVAVVFAISISNEAKKSKGETPKRISGVFAWGCALAMVWFFQTILNDLLTIVTFGFVGQVVASIFDLTATYKFELSQKYRDANITAEALNNSNGSNKKTNYGGILG